jgi:hypothetical protein
MTTADRFPNGINLVKCAENFTDNRHILFFAVGEPGTSTKEVPITLVLSVKNSTRNIAACVGKE